MTAETPNAESSSAVVASPANAKAAGVGGANEAASDLANRLERWLARWLERGSDLLNPILVKETRQGLKSRQFALWFLLLLLAAWIVTIGAVALIGPNIYYAASGAVLYRAYFVVLAFPLMVVAPFAAYRSLAAEQEENTRDLLMVSALSPRQIINGKLGSAALQMMVYVSALSPCLAFTYLLRGIDLVTVLLLPVYTLLASLMLSMVGLVAASLTRRRHGQVVVSIGFIMLLLGAFGWLSAGAMELIESGFRYFRNPEFWIGNLCLLNFYVTTFLLLYFCATALNTFTAANRSTPLRVVLFLKTACAVGWMAYACVENGYRPEPIVAGAAIIGIGLYFAASVMAGESPVMSDRVRRALPTSGAARLFVTWFNPGPGSGLMFALANWLAVAAPILVWLMASGRQNTSEAVVFLVLGLAYAVIFLGLGWLAVVVLRRFTQVTMMGCLLINFLLMLGASASPLLVTAWFERAAPGGYPGYYAVSPLTTLAMIMGRRVPWETQVWLLVAVGGVAVCVLMLLLKIAGREARRLRKPTPKRVIEDEQELSPLPAATVRNPWGDT